MDAEDTTHTLTVGELRDALADMPADLRVAAEGYDGSLFNAIGLLRFQRSLESAIVRLVIRVTDDDPASLCDCLGAEPDGR